LLFTKKYGVAEYPCLNIFILSFLEMDQEYGYNYLLLNILEYYKLIGHGAGIRSAWLESLDCTIFENRKVSESTEVKFLNWAQNIVKK
jgi:hypothetical protein